MEEGKADGVVTASESKKNDPLDSLSMGVFAYKFQMTLWFNYF